MPKGVYGNRYELLLVNHAFYISNRMKGIYVLTNYLWTNVKRLIHTHLEKIQINPKCSKNYFEESLLSQYCAICVINTLASRLK